jgi:hypothetical protein
MAGAEARGDPVSWLMIEPGWSVVASDGTEIGRVDQVVGDPVAGIFNGLAIITGAFSASRHLPAERVGTIYEGRVEADIDAAAAEGLDLHDAPPSIEVRPD